MKKTFLLLFVSLLLTAQIFATDYVVSGAGSNEVNGTYTESGTYNGKPQYQLGATFYYLRYNDWGPMRWEILDVRGATYYYTNDAGDTPPSTGWNSYEGFPPAPTVGLAGPSLSYSSGTFSESSANDGSIDNSTPVIITHNNFDGETFTGTNGDNFVTADKVTVSNLPTGLTAVITRTSSTTLSVTITGTAPSHNNENDVSNLTFAFQNSAFSTGDASSISNSTKSDLMVDFNQEYYVATSGGDFTTIAAAIAAAGNGDVINVAAETFTEVELVVDKDLTIRGQGADVTIIQADVTQNTATHGVFNINSGKIAAIENVTIRHGKASNEGGGIANHGTLTLHNATISYNNCPYEGGGIYHVGENMSINNCLINNNTVNSDYAQGGGVSIAGGVNATITNSTITANTSISTSQYHGRGGGIAQSSESILSLINCTITNNTVSSNGGGYYTNVGYLTISNTIIADNGSSDYYVVWIYLTDNGNNIIKNQAMSNGTNWKFSALTNILYNYKADGTASTSWNRNNAALANQYLNISATLADNNTLNGTQTLALSSGSFAIDAGTDVGAPTTDQRGAGRNGTTDIGAYEWWDDAGALPVELTSFSASVNGSSVVLNWQTATEVNNYGFEVERGSRQQAVGNSVWVKVGFVQGNGNSNSPKEYTFTDEKISNGKYSYRLKQIDSDGKYEYSKEIEIDVDKIPTVFALAQNYPNPFNPATVISFQLPVDSKVQLKIYDVVGSEVATLVNEERPAGIHHVEFNAGGLASGIYFYSLQAGEFVQTKKFVLMK